MSPRRLVVVSAGLGQPSSTRLLADRLAAATERHLRDRGLEPSVEIVELRGHAQDLANHLLTGFPSPALQVAIDAVLGADGLIAVSPIFSASYSGLFKMFFDVIDRDGLAGKPTLLAATGGTARHSLALEYAFRPLFAYLDAATVATAVYAAAEDWGSAGLPSDGSLVGRIDGAAAELATAMAAREPGRTRDAFADPIPFEQASGVPSRARAAVRVRPAAEGLGRPGTRRAAVAGRPAPTGGPFRPGAGDKRPCHPGWLSGYLVSMTNEVRALREARALSQGQLATELGVSRQTINAIETGRYLPSLPLAFAIARYFRRRIEEVFHDHADV